NQKFEIEWPPKIPAQLSLLMLDVPSGTNIDELRQDVQRIYPSIVKADSQPTYKSITRVNVRLDFRNSTEYERYTEIGKISLDHFEFKIKEFFRCDFQPATGLFRRRK
ncbi:unnamed protein product, partial [Didymodactylos carnosus]